MNNQLIAIPDFESDEEPSVEDITAEMRQQLKNSGIDCDIRDIGKVKLPRSKDDPDKMPFELAIRANGLLGKSDDDPDGYEIEVRGMFKFDAKSIEDAIALSQNYLPYKILDGEDISKLEWAPHKKRLFTLALVRSDGTQGWDIFVSLEGIEEVIDELVKNNIPTPDTGGESDGDTTGDEPDQSTE